MKIQDYANQFTVGLWTQSLEPGASLKIFLSQAGFDTFFVQEKELLLEKIKNFPPHILVVDYKDLATSVRTDMHEIFNLNPEIQWIFLAESKDLPQLLSLKAYGIVDIICEKNETLAACLQWSIEKACEKLFFIYQNEQLLHELKKATPVQLDQMQLPESSTSKITEYSDNKSELGQTSDALSGELDPQHALQENSMADNEFIIKEFRAVATQEELIQKLVVFLPPKSMMLYFKFLPSIQAFVATHCCGLPQEQIQGVGCRLSLEEQSTFSADVILGRLPLSLASLLEKAFQKNKFKVQPLFLQNQLQGLIVEMNLEIYDQHYRDLLSLFSLAFSNFFLEKKIDALEVKDFVTEVGNRSYYLKTLSVEWARARRSKKPLAIVKLAIDHIFEIEQAYGENIRDMLFKKLAEVLQQTSRTHDAVARAQFNEFVLILPECSKTGAVMKAERIRRLIAKQNWLENRMKITLSVGISEYPSLSSTAEGLDDNASKALNHIQEKSGDKICVYKMAENHQPEFTVDEGG